jgi:hypothetical protein
MRSDWIVLSEMSVPCVLGLYEWERQSPQALVAEVSMALDLDQAASGDLSASVDYAAGRGARASRAGAHQGDEARHLRRAVPGVELLRNRAWSGQRCVAHTNREDVKVESLTEAPDTGAYHVSLEPGAAWPLLELSTAEVVAGAVGCDDRRLIPGERCGAPGVLRADQGTRARVVVVGPRPPLREGARV